ncbi:hypothetical protein EVAR_95277_1 [Eumeta japonica]|uniref:Uncharacterized protein n=1 Tax=Eumeta variegata TaxID=151549 RepID=A0A4C1UK08_EUMVA|nr:hypothetical protein EVAR_95277_1 [Eumeta japonica]
MHAPSLSGARRPGRCACVFCDVVVSTAIPRIRTLRNATNPICYFPSPALRDKARRFGRPTAFRACRVGHAAARYVACTNTERVRFRDCDVAFDQFAPYRYTLTCASSYANGWNRLCGNVRIRAAFAILRRRPWVDAKRSNGNRFSNRVWDNSSHRHWVKCSHV